MSHGSPEFFVGPNVSNQFFVQTLYAGVALIHVLKW